MPSAVSWLHCSEEDRPSCPLPVQQDHGSTTAAPLLLDTEPCARDTGHQEDRTILPPASRSKITLIMAEGISVPWRNELGVFQASCLIKYFHSLTLQLQAAAMGGCSSDLVISARTAAHMAQ